MVKLINKKQKNSPFPKKKSLVRLTPGRIVCIASTKVLWSSGSQHLEIDDPQKRIKHNLATHIVLKYYYNTAFGDPK